MLINTVSETAGAKLFSNPKKPMMIPFNQSLIDAALQERADKTTRIWINYKNDNDNVFRLNQLLGFLFFFFFFF